MIASVAATHGTHIAQLAYCTIDFVTISLLCGSHARPLAGPSRIHYTRLVLVYVRYIVYFNRVDTGHPTGSRVDI